MQEHDEAVPKEDRRQVVAWKLLNAPHQVRLALVRRGKPHNLWKLCEKQRTCLLGIRRARVS